MNHRHALQPDLTQCVLEDRALMAIIGLTSPQFIPNGSNNSFNVPGTSAPGTGSQSLYPGPTYYYLLIGSNGNNAIAGSRIGGAVSVYGLTTSSSTVGVPLTVGSGANDAHATGAGTFRNFGGFGGNISSGYNFALNITNNYGMSGTAIGSVAPHTYDHGPVERSQSPADNADKPPAPNEAQSVPAVPLIDTTKSPLVPGINRGNNLLQNNLTGRGLLPGVMPGAPPKPVTNP